MSLSASVIVSTDLSTVSRLKVVPGLDGDGRVERAGVDAGSLEFDGDGAESEALALLDGEGDGIAGALGVLDGLGGEHARVGEAVLEVMAAQQLLVALDALGIVERRALEDVEPAGLAGGDDVAQLAFGVGRLPTKEMLSTLVTSPSLTTNTTSTRPSPCGLVLASTVVPSRPWRR